MKNDFATDREEEKRTPERTKLFEWLEKKHKDNVKKGLKVPAGCFLQLGVEDLTVAILARVYADGIHAALTGTRYGGSKGETYSFSVEAGQLISAAWKKGHEGLPFEPFKALCIPKD